MGIFRQSFKFYLATVFLLFATTLFSQENNHQAQNSEHSDGLINTKNEVDDYIQHHIQDAHDFTLFSYTNDDGERKHLGFPLPIIIWTSKGLTSFMSSAFQHNDNGEVIVEKNELQFAKIHGKIFELEQGATAVNFDEEHHATNAERVLDLSITKSVIGVLIIGLLMFIWFFGLARQYKTKKVPTGFGRVLEPLVIYVRDEIARPNIGEKHYRRFTGYLLTVFFLIWLLNVAGLTPFGFNITGQLAVTAALAIFTLVIYTVSGNKDYWRHMLWMPDVPVLVRPVLAVIEIAGAFLIKPFALMIRLFANITAGHIVVMSLIAVMFVMRQELGVVSSSFISIALSILITFIEILVTFLQAYIFTMLSALFIGMAVAEHDHDHVDANGGHHVVDAEDVRSDFI